MEKVADKKILVAADIAGYPLKEAVINDLEKKGWEITDIGVTSKNKDNPEMFHRIGFRAGSMISEKNLKEHFYFVEQVWEYILRLVNVLMYMLQ